jgi:DNA-binding response OmpR family regulator
MVVDVNLGAGTTGYDVARFARRIDPELAVIFVSGQTSRASFEANGVPGSLFLEKPFTVQDVLVRLRKLVGDNDD